MEITGIVANQKKYFMTGVTKPLPFRLDALSSLQSALRVNEQKINDALKTDLNKCPFEAYMTETGSILAEIRFHFKHLRRWMRIRTVATPLWNFHAKSFVMAEPYGVALIISPWNYPIQLSLDPLLGAISAGNCVVLKPSAYAPATSHALAQIIAETYPPEYITVVEGGRQENSTLLDQKFDYIFFTGSTEVGRVVMAAAAKNLIPVTLELGGKSPVIVDKTANLKLTARRVAFGKVANAGQTCVEPDYMFIHEDVKDAFIKEYKAALNGFFPDGNMSDMPVIINDKHFNRLTKLIMGENVVLGGNGDPSRRFIEPTLIDGVSKEAPIMQEEIFGPILPIMTYKSLDEAIDYINAGKKPLALYLFTSDKNVEKKVLDSTSSGGGCINDTIIHLANPHMGFGGVGDSGMGSYHGKLSFDTFTHYKSFTKKYTWIDLTTRYHPYLEMNFKVIKMLFK
jgi:aldehyde dehydrogenase (NAD+)